MNTLLTSFESVFYHLISLSAFDHFLTLLLFGIVFQLKDWRNFISLFLAVSIGSLVGFLLAAFKVTSFSFSTIKLSLALAFLVVSLHHMISNSLSANAIRYNFFALIGIVLGTGISLRYLDLFGSGLKFLGLSGYILGTTAAYFFISFAGLLVSSLIIAVFKTDRKSFNLALSGIGAGIALVLIYLRY